MRPGFESHFSNFPIGRFAITAAVFCGLLIGLNATSACGQDKKKGVATIRGRIAYDKTRIQSYDENRLVIPYEDIETKIRQKVTPLNPPYPRGFEKLKPDAQLKWEKDFIESSKGKKFIAANKKLVESASAFDVKFEKDGKFVIYDVPYGTYGIQGRTDKEINGKFYAFEVYGEIPVVNGMDDIPLKPMRVEVTPLVKRGEDAPPIAAKTHNNKLVLSLDHKSFDGKMVFLNFWISKSPTSAAEQRMVQAMYTKLKQKHNLKLISICVDSDRKKALKYIIKNKLKEGSHGFTDGVEHRTIFDYGVRSFPSFWLIGPDGKVMMTQYEVAQAMRVKPNMATIVEDRISGKDVPTPAAAEKPGEADEPTSATNKKRKSDEG